MRKSWRRKRCQPFPGDGQTVSGGPPGVGTSQRILDDESRSFPHQFKKSVRRLRALSNRNVGENAIQVALRPGTDPSIHSPLFPLPSEFSAPLTNPCPHRIGKRRVFAVYSFLNQGVKFVRVRRLVGLQDEQFLAAGNDRWTALKRSVGQPAKAALCFAETTSFHACPKNGLFFGPLSI